jgi:hypothetical protein
VNKSGISIQSTEAFQQASTDAVIIRCGCGDPGRIHPGAVCPTPRKIEDIGTVAYWHKSWYMRVFYRIRRLFNPNAKVWKGQLKDV